MNNKKPEPLISRRIHDRCAVCGETSYSASGIHPQCAVRHADEIRLKTVKTKKHDQVDVESDNRPKSWQKKCPSCKLVLHVRKKICSCGYDFSIRSGSSRTGNETL